MDQLTIVDEYPDFNLVVTDKWAPIYSRACNPFGCLPEDIFIQVSPSNTLASIKLTIQ